MKAFTLTTYDDEIYVSNGFVEYSNEEEFDKMAESTSLYDDGGNHRLMKATMDNFCNILVLDPQLSDQIDALLNQ